MRDLWREAFVLNRLHSLIDHGIDLVRVANDHFFSNVFAHEAEFIQHLLGGIEVQVRVLLVAVWVTPLGSQQYVPVDGFMLVDVVGIASCHDRLVQFLAQLVNIGQNFFQLGFISNQAIGN